MQTPEQLTEENLLLRQEIAFLKEELAQLKRMIFGSKKERFVPTQNGQQALFGEEEKPEVPARQETIEYSRKKPSGGKAKRLMLPAHLPRKEEVIEPEGIVPESSTKIGEKVTEVLEYTPGKFYVAKTVRPVYKTTQKNGGQREEQVVVAELPAQVIPRGNAGASLLAYLMVGKFIDHLPYYRQAQIFKRDGIKIPESTITGWFRKICELIGPLYELMCRQIQLTDYIQGDESPIAVLTKDKPGSTHRGYHWPAPRWVFLLPKKEMVIFQYAPSRGQEVPEEILSGFTGCLQTDGYVGYAKVAARAEITHIACMAHARRKFEAALENDRDRASHALGLFQRLYETERKARDEGLSAGQIKELRQKEAVPVLDELKTWMVKTAPEVLPKSSTGKAIAYTLKLWNELTAYTRNGEWAIDNNPVENKIRPLALGRKNYLFAGSHQAAQQAAMMYTFFGTCKLNDIEPLEWLTETLRKLPETKLPDLHTLLPLKKQDT